jgi:hypothetical protein
MTSSPLSDMPKSLLAQGIATLGITCDLCQRRKPSKRSTAGGNARVTLATGGRLA